MRNRRVSESASQRVSKSRITNYGFHVSRFTFHALLLLILVVAGCGKSRPSATGKLRVVATTTIVGDVVKQVGGESIELALLLPYGADPHSFSPSPQDVAKVADADLVFANGLGMEGFLENLLESAGEGVNIVYVSDGLDLPHVEETAEEHEDEHGEDEHHHGGVDPHTWTDPVYVSHWVDQIETALAQHDPDHAELFRSNAAAYRGQLAELDAWIAKQVTQIPVDNRKLVCDHAMFAHFADRYGFVQVGTVVPGYSSAAQPSAQALAELEDAIRDLEVRAVFVGKTVNPNLAERVAQDTGSQLVTLYTGSLTAPGGDADTYLDYMRYNVTQIVEALR
ncbi:MAG: zinc ABC transporter substrate-binding protein [Anaerolineae bacterium]|nr:zinc ABC transporter substrate-binding protein [Anaerolineae bacterium]